MPATAGAAGATPSGSWRPCGTPASTQHRLPARHALHNDHVGGVPELLERIPVGTFVDYGEPLGIDRMATGGFRAYEPVRAAWPHLEAGAGRSTAAQGSRRRQSSAPAARLVSTPLGGAVDDNERVRGRRGPRRGRHRELPVGGRDVRFGAFRFLDLGDLSGNTLTGLACPTNRSARCPRISSPTTGTTTPTCPRSTPRCGRGWRS